MKTVDSLHFKDKKALVRVDFNVPLNDKYEITDLTRIKAVEPTIRKILNDGGSVILMSHMGRPKSGPEEMFSLKHIVNELSDRFGTIVKFASDCIGEESIKLSEALKPGEILLLENLRFHADEKKGDAGFRQGPDARSCRPRTSPIS